MAQFIEVREVSEAGNEYRYTMHYGPYKDFRLARKALRDNGWAEVSVTSREDPTASEKCYEKKVRDKVNRARIKWYENMELAENLP